MTAVNKMRIICDPYAKVIDYKWFDAAEGEFVRIEEYSSELVSEKYVNATIQNRAFEIMEIINRNFNRGNIGLEIDFIGNDDDYRDLCRVIELYYADSNIVCTKNKEFFYGADYVMAEIKDRFNKVKTTLEEYQEENIIELIQKYEDTVKPSVSVCVLGLYSAGKSAFINSLIGEEILPSGSDPTTAKVFRIHCSDYYSVFFDVDGIPCTINFDGEISIDGISDTTLKDSILEKIQKHDNPAFEINDLLSLINKGKLTDNAEHSVGEVINIFVPFRNSSLPTGKFDFVIYDTPGSNSDTNKKHLDILESSLDSQTNALPVFLTTPDTMDSTDNDKLLSLIEKTGTALDVANAIIVVNKSDEKGANALNNKRDKCEDLKITKWKSTRIYFLSSIIALASKKENPHNEDDWFDEDTFEIFDDKCRKYESGERKLFQYNIIDKSKELTLDEKELTTSKQLFYNSGLAGIENEVSDYAQRYALYNKCLQAIDYLEQAIEICSKEIENAEIQLNEQLDDISYRFDEKKRELIDKIDNQRLDSLQYSLTESEKVLDELLQQYKQDKDLIYDFNPFTDIKSSWDLDIYKDFEAQWNKYKQLAESLHYDNKYALSKMQIYVKNKYNVLINDYSVSANETLDAFWIKRTSVFKKICQQIVMGEDSLSAEQKAILDSVIFDMDDMIQERVEFDLSENSAINMGILPILGLKDIYNNRKCCENLITEFSKVVTKRIADVRTENGRHFEKWTADLIGKIKMELCKFNSELHDFELKIEEINNDIKNKKSHLRLIQDTREYIGGLLNTQVESEDE